mgnify:CR=1 FL=1
MTWRTALKTGLAALLATAGIAAAQNEADITGAGASFPAPLIATWADLYRDVTGGAVVVNYQSIGSGGGISNFIEQTIHFGATEAFLNDEQLAAARGATGGEAYNLPVTLADVVVTYNVPGVDSGLVLTGNVIARIFLGEINQWNDAALQELNPGVSLPLLPISVVHRADGHHVGPGLQHPLVIVDRADIDTERHESQQDRGKKRHHDRDRPGFVAVEGTGRSRFRGINRQYRRSR